MKKLSKPISGSIPKRLATNMQPVRSTMRKPLKRKLSKGTVLK